MYVCICIYAYIYIYTYMYVYVCMYICIYIYIYIYLCVCVRVCECVEQYEFTRASCVNVCVRVRTYVLVHTRTTVFVKHCECIAQKCTHLERLSPLVSHWLLLRHCVLTWYEGKKKSHEDVVNIQDPTQSPSVRTCLSLPTALSTFCTRWAVLHSFGNANYYKPQITTFCWERKNSVNAENNESFICILFKLCVQV